MKFRKFILFLGLILFSFSATSQSEKFQAVFIYNFTKHIEWPESLRSGDFIIGVLGSSPIISELETLAQSRKVGNQQIVVKRFKTTDEISLCHIIYIPSGRSGDLGAVIAAVKNHNSLIITDKEGLINAGAAINFVVSENKQKFELKKSNATKYGLKVSSDLERLAIVVN